MIDVTILPVFLMATLFLVISPGPDLLLISAYSSGRGFKAGMMISFGIFIAGLIQTALVTFGLGKIMQEMPSLIWGIKVVGALYLSWLGIKLLRAWFKNRAEVTSDRKLKALSSLQLMHQGLLNNLMNPKALLFFSMFLPQFTSTQSDLTTQILLLGLLLSGTALFINMFFAFSFSKLGTYFGNKVKLGRHSDGILGVIFLGLAARLATSR